MALPVCLGVGNDPFDRCRGAQGLVLFSQHRHLKLLTAAFHLYIHIMQANMMHISHEKRSYLSAPINVELFISDPLKLNNFPHDICLCIFVFVSRNAKNKAKHFKLICSLSKKKKNIFCTALIMCWGKYVCSKHVCSKVMVFKCRLTSGLWDRCQMFVCETVLLSHSRVFYFILIMEYLGGQSDHIK